MNAPGWGRRSLVAAATLGAWAGWQAARVKRARRRTDRTDRFRHVPEDPRHCVVVAGDSTAVGVGAGNPRLSVAGRLALALRDARIVNVAHSGARLADVPHQLRRVFGLIDASLCVVLCGANDVLRFTSPARVRRNVRALIGLAQRADVPLVLVPPGHIGAAPLWLPPLSWLLSWRARGVRRALFRAAHKQSGVEVVDLVLPARQDPFRAAPAAHYAADGLHPNANGYGQWFEQLVQQSRAVQHRLPPARRAPREQLAHRLFR